MFVDRERELEFLERKWKEKSAQLIIIYGRRRVGKTMLLKEFLKDKGGVYFLATADSMGENVKGLAEKFAELTGREYFKEVEDFGKLFRYLADELKNERVAVVLDEFQYLMSLKPGILSILQKVWDEHLRDTGIFLVLCGSSIGMMERVMEYRSPLYGRRTGQWKVEPFDIRAIAEMLPDRSMEELVKTYAVFGGVPFYLDLAKGLGVEKAIREKVLRKGEVLYEEPEFLLREELREPRVYKLILKGISLGYETLGELVNFTGLNRGNLSRYLDTLERLGIVGYELPYGKRKRGRYYIKDNFFNFWFRFVYPNLADLELGLVDEVWVRVEKDLNAYYGRMFERLIREMLKMKILDFGQRRVARWWHKGEEIDAILELDDGLLFVEVKWGRLRRREAERILGDLEKKAERFEGKKKFLLIARKIDEKGGGMMDLEDIEALVR
ncbi:ATP-binding protein [Thermococcus barophilus]|uniref:Prokaryotic ATPase, AAA superfamily n=1 Tax=Thermococcus barophilus TaxID=55802 RepID=A0A0S1XAP9_THEBA|nr:ATP-binding protein [Thermococcus barophilus]ALM74800.1 Prokaryotic ATPase, AAA superfamily [Thermococcus barophilus]